MKNKFKMKFINTLKNQKGQAAVELALILPLLVLLILSNLQFYEFVSKSFEAQWKAWKKARIALMNEGYTTSFNPPNRWRIVEHKETVDVEIYPVFSNFLPSHLRKMTRTAYLPNYSAIGLKKHWFYSGWQWQTHQNRAKAYYAMY